MASTDAQELFEAMHADEDDAVIMAVLRRAKDIGMLWNHFGAGKTHIELTVAADVTDDELAAISRLSS